MSAKEEKKIVNLFTGETVPASESKFERVCSCSDEKNKIVYFKAVNRDLKGNEHYMEYWLDLSKLSQKEILEHAAANLNIRWARKQLFEQTADLSKLHGEKIDIETCRPERKSKLTDEEKAMRAIKKLAESMGISVEKAIGLLSKK